MLGGCAGTCGKQNQRAGKQIVDCDLKSAAKNGSTETGRLKNVRKLEFIWFHWFNISTIIQLIFGLDKNLILIF